MVLSKLAQLEVANKNVTVASFESVAKFLDGVSVDECASCFALCVDSASYIAEAFTHVIAYAVDVAVGLAAALLCSETVLNIHQQFSQHFYVLRIVVSFFSIQSCRLIS